MMKFKTMLVASIYYFSALNAVAGVIPGFEPVWEVEKPKVLNSVGHTWTDPVTGMEFVFVKGECFQMGDIFDDGGSNLSIGSAWTVFIWANMK